MEERCLHLGVGVFAVRWHTQKYFAKPWKATWKLILLAEKKQDATIQVTALDKIRKNYGLKFKDSKLKSTPAAI